MPTEFIAKKFSERGWRDIKNATGLCPDCCAKPAPKKPQKPLGDDPESRLVKWDEFAEAKAHKAAEKRKAEGLPPAPPIERPDAAEIEALIDSLPGRPAGNRPGRQEIRRILGALEKVYDIPHQQYRETWTDASLAKSLDLEVDWVAEERTRAFGPNRNAAQTHRIEIILGKLKFVEDKALALAQEAMDLTDQLNRLKNEYDLA